MLYSINGKYYILVSGYYKEVIVIKNGEEYNVKPVEKINNTSLEASTVKNVSILTVKKAYELQHKASNAISRRSIDAE